MTRTIFLPGAGGSAAFWKPVADRMGLEGTLLAWPGLGDEPAHPRVSSIDGLVALVLNEMSDPVNLVAQSMGGLVALKVAIAEPRKIRRLVLTATSGGVPFVDLHALDWRSEYYRIYPNAARWIGEASDDLSNQLSSVEAATLLLWGDRDFISPVAVGERLQALLPNAELHAIPGADHDLAETHAEIVGEAIANHFSIAS